MSSCPSCQKLLLVKCVQQVGDVQLSQPPALVSEWPSTATEAANCLGQRPGSAFGSGLPVKPAYAHSTISPIGSPEKEDVEQPHDVLPHIVPIGRDAGRDITRELQEVSPRTNTSHSPLRLRPDSPPPHPTVMPRVGFLILHKAEMTLLHL